MVLLDAQRRQLLGSVVFVQLVGRLLPQLLEVVSHQQLSQLDKVAVLLVVHLNHSPGVGSASHGSAVGGLHLLGGAHNGKGHLGHDLVGLGDGLGVVVLVLRRRKDVNLLVSNVGQNSSLEVLNLLVGQSVGLGNHGDQVDLLVQLLHHGDVQGLERVAGGLDEVDTRVDSRVVDGRSVDPVLGVEVGVKPLVNVVHNGLPRVAVVDKVSETGGVDHGQMQPHVVLLNVLGHGLDLHGLERLRGGVLAWLGRVQVVVEECAHQGGLSKTGLADNQDVEVEALLDGLSVPLVGQVGEADVAAELLSDDVGLGEGGGDGGIGAERFVGGGLQSEGGNGGSEFRDLGLVVDGFLVSNL